MTQLRFIVKIAACACLVAVPAFSQEAAPAPKTELALTAAKTCFLEAELCVGTGESAAAQASQTNPTVPTGTMPQNATTPPATTSQPGATKLAIRDAEQLALKNHPRITIGELNALAARQVEREQRAAFLPTIAGNATGVTTNQDGNRITAGLLNNPTVFDRAAAGLLANQLITDFGRTRNLYASSKFNALAEQQTARATREQIVFAVDQAFYNALSADVLVKVAQQTVEARQVVANQIQALENAKLRSALDVSFANVALAQAQLLLVDANNNRGVAYAILSEALGLPNERAFELVDTAPPLPPSQDIDTVIQQALDNRPDLKALELQQSAAEHLATAEERLQLPDINALGAAGTTPVASDLIHPHSYGAIGVNVHVPIFNGFLFQARASEARFRAKAAQESVRDLRDRVARDVRQAWLNANSAFEREDVAAKLLQQATLSLNLAQARYNLGLGSIVELSQAQLQQTEAEIGTVTAKYQYELSLSALTYQLGNNAP